MGTFVTHFPKHAEELAYWQEQGLALGTDVYVRYLKLLGLEGQDWSDLWVADLGCGPFGGMLSVIKPRKGYAADVLADTYAKWGHSTSFLVTHAREGRFPIPTASCDVTFALDVFDHAAFPWGLAKEVTRITRPSGCLFVFIHPKRSDGSHQSLTVRGLSRWLGFYHDKPWRWMWKKKGKDLVHDAFQEAMWGQLERRKT